MTLLFEHTAEGTTDEADVPSGAGANDFTSPINKVGACTIKYDAAHAMHGTRSIRFTRVAGTDTGYARKTLAAAVTRMQSRAYVRIDALPTSQLNLFTFRNASGFMGNVGLNLPGLTAGRLGLLNATGASINASISPADFPLTQYVRIESAIKKGTTTADGTIEFAYYIGDSSTPEHTWTSVGSGLSINTGIVDPIECRWGINGTTAVPADVWMDDPALGDGATSWLGPSSVTTPVISINGELRYMIDARASSVPSPPAAFSISPSAGTTEIVEGVFLVIPTTAPQTFTITAQGATGSPISQDWVVPANTGGSPVRDFLMEAGVLV